MAQSVNVVMNRVRVGEQVACENFLELCCMESVIKKHAGRNDVTNYTGVE